MREELIRLYQEEQPTFLKVVKTFPQDDLAGPFLMSPNHHYAAQRFPLLIVGPETNGWTRYIDEIERQMGTYENYNVGVKESQTAFWKVIRQVEKMLGNDAFSCAWTNLSRFDLYGGKPHGQYSKVISLL